MLKYSFLLLLVSLAQCRDGGYAAPGKQNWDSYSYGSPYHPRDNDGSYVPPRGYGGYGSSSGCEAGDVFGC